MLTRKKNVYRTGSCVLTNVLELNKYQQKKQLLSKLTNYYRGKDYINSKEIPIESRHCDETTRKNANIRV